MKKRPLMDAAKTPKLPRATVLKAVTKALVKSLLLAAILLAPGVILLISGQTFAGMMCLFLGAFILMAKSYRNPWRLGLVSCLIPPVTAGVCYVVQLTLFGQAVPAAAVLAAVGAGLFIGLLRARSHQITTDETGALVAQRTFGYLLIWVIAYGATQGFGYFARDSLAVRAGLVTGAFSTTMLAMVSLVIWGKFRKVKAASQILVVWVAFGLTLFFPEPVMAQVADQSGNRITQDTKLCFTHRYGMEVQAYRTQAEHPQAEGCLFFATCREFMGYPRDSNGNVSVNTYEGRKVMEDASYCRAVTYEARAASPPTSSASLTPTTEICLNANGDPIRSLGPAKGFTYKRGYELVQSGCRAVVTCEYWDQSALYSAWIQHSTAQNTRRSRPDLNIPRWEFNEDMFRDSRQKSQAFGCPMVGGVTAAEARKAEIAKTTAAVAAALIAAGIAVNIAQALAAALAQAMQAGAQITAEEINEALLNALAEGESEDPNEDGASSLEGDAPKPPPVYFAEGDPFETNERGEYFAPDKNGVWAWRSEAEAREFEAWWRADKARVEAVQNKENAARETARRKSMERSRKQMRENTEAERKRVHRQQQASKDVAGISALADKHGASAIFERANSEAIYNPDGSLNEDYIARLKHALRNKLSRDAATSDPDFNDNSPTRIARETFTGSMDDASNSLAVRAGLGMASGGWSEGVFQGREAWNSVREAAEKATDEGRTMSRTDALRRTAAKFRDDNLPVNTMNTIAAAGKEGRSVGMLEMGASLLADGFSLMDVGEVGTKITGIKSGDVAEGLARKVLPKDVYEGGARAIQNGKVQVNSKIGALGQQVDTVRAKGASALERMGWKSEPPRLTAAHAEHRLRSGTLTTETEALLTQTRNTPDARTQAMSEAAEWGRGGGKAKVDQFEAALAELDAAKKSGSATPAQMARAEQKVRDAMMEVQGDKHAMNELNALNQDGTGHNTIEQFNTHTQSLHRKVDEQVINRIARENNVRPQDVEVVTITNDPAKGGAVDSTRPQRQTDQGLATPWKEDGRVGDSRARPSQSGTVDGAETGRQAPSETKAPSRTKVGMDRDVTYRIRTGVDARGETRIHYRDVPSSTSGRIYNEEFFEQSTGKTLANKRGPEGGGGKTDFKDTHLSGVEQTGSIHDINDPDKFARRADQATTDRLHPEAYGTGQADLDAATKDSHRGRDFTDAAGTSKTIEYKVDHWMNASDDLKKLASETRDPAMKRKLLSQASANLEEAQRQLHKQYGNMGIKRMSAMQASLNAHGARIPQGLAERIGVLDRVFNGNPKISPAEAEAVLNNMRPSTGTRQVARQLSSFVEGLEKLRPTQIKSPTIVFQGWQDDVTPNND